ncbi:GNAT family N-acetyltransferase [Shewanella mesophila]|uniref:GNAT family N-acetyltransferase n=1 Tax=Shewanella mesophila TaxID=2864208 RepID=UPI001C65A7B0|nr:GNAT family N-acetyltransferase [Shewanella mesophila]QYJ87638.1 GNAT family N-acetyltransferase [Shewanella mesophila]
MSGEIRRVTLEDVDVVAQLFDEYRQFYHQESNIPLATQFISTRLLNRDSIIFVVLDNQGVALGFCQLYPSFSSISAQSMLILSDLYVTQHARCVGLGRRLMNTAMEYARTKNVKTIFLETHKQNHQAQALYESLGFIQEKEFLSYNLDIE